MEEQKSQNDSQEAELDKEREYRLQYVRFLTDLMALEAKLAELDVQREDTRKQIERMRRIVSDLGQMHGLSDGSQSLGTLGFTDAVRVVIRNASPNFISANDIREKLQQGGFDLTQYQNASASIYTILTRLEERDFVEKKSEGFNVLYRLKVRRRRVRNKAFYGEK
jgi:hypothetical protein